VPLADTEMWPGLMPRLLYLAVGQLACASLQQATDGSSQNTSLLDEYPPPDVCHKDVFCTKFCAQDTDKIFGLGMQCHYKCKTEFDHITDIVTTPKRRKYDFCKDRENASPKSVKHMCNAFCRKFGAHRRYCLKPCTRAVGSRGKSGYLGDLFSAYCDAGCESNTYPPTITTRPTHPPTTRTTTTTGKSICEKPGLCSAICSIGFAGRRCLHSCSTGMLQVSSKYCRCGPGDERHHLLQTLQTESEETNLLHIRAVANTTGATDWIWRLKNKLKTKVFSRRRRKDDKDDTDDTDDTDDCKSSSPLQYCKKICDDGLKYRGFRERSCVESCQKKWNEVKIELENYKSSCDCKDDGSDSRRRKQDDDSRRRRKGGGDSSSDSNGDGGRRRRKGGGSSDSDDGGRRRRRRRGGGSSGSDDGGRRRRRRRGGGSSGSDDGGRRRRGGGSSGSDDAGRRRLWWNFKED